MHTIHTILHPTDFSESADQAFHLACSLARDHNARLIVLHVMPTPITTLGGMPAVPPIPDEYGREELAQKLRAVQAPPPAIPLDHMLEEGDPIATILQLAERVPCDLIVMGTHGRRGLGRLLMGSVAEEVMRKAPCPVLTVRSQLAVAAKTRKKAGAAN
jgi:nucleotide-binding universal stress UspA family protein